MGKILLGLSLLSAAISASGSGFVPPAYHEVARVKIGGPGGWDYLIGNAQDRHVFISRGTHVVVLDMDSLKVVGDIPDTPGVHGIALANDLGRGFTSNGRANSVTIFDLKTLQTIGKVDVGTNPDAIVYDPASKCVLTMNGGSNNSSVIDAATGTLVGTIPLDGRPEFAAADGHGGVFVNIEDKSELSSLDVKKLSVKATWSLSPGDGPSGLAVDPRGHHSFSVCGNKTMVVVDTRTGKVVGTPTIGEGPDAALFDAGARLAFSSNGRDGTLTVVDSRPLAGFAVVATVPTARGARTMALDEKTHRIFLATAEFAPTPAGQTAPRRPAMVPDSFTILVMGP